MLSVITVAISLCFHMPRIITVAMCVWSLLTSYSDHINILLVHRVRSERERILELRQEVAQVCVWLLHPAQMHVKNEAKHLQF